MGRAPNSKPALRSKATSAAGNASVSLIARRAMYWAVHSPTPRMFRRRAIVCSTVSNVLNKSVSTAACARAFSVARRAAGMGRLSKSVAANRSAEGNTRESLGSPCTPRPRVSPQRSTRIAARRRAPCTVICWPRMARTASKWIPSSGQSQTWTFGYQRRQKSVACQVTADSFNVCSRIEHTPYPADDFRQHFQM